MNSYASIDIGSNSVRMLVGRIEDGKIIPIKHERAVTRLAKGIVETGRLSEDSVEATLRTLKKYKSEAASLGVLKIASAATSAVREASNSAEFLSSALRETGLRIEVLSGIDEARITAVGVNASLSGTPSGCLIVDIGGGSTEWIISGPEGLRDCGSIKLGVVKLYEKFIKSDPPSKAEIDAMKDFMRQEAADIKTAVKKSAVESPVLIMTAGTPTTLASIDLGLEKYSAKLVHLRKMSLRRVSEIWDMLSRMGMDERRRVRGLEPGRADLIIPGAVLTMVIMEEADFAEFTVSDAGLLEGLLIRAAGD